MSAATENRIWETKLKRNRLKPNQIDISQIKRFLKQRFKLISSKNILETEKNRERKRSPYIFENDKAK